MKPVFIDFNVFKLSLCFLFNSPVSGNREREVDTVWERHKESSRAVMRKRKRNLIIQSIVE